MLYLDIYGDKICAKCINGYRVEYGKKEFVGPMMYCAEFREQPESIKVGKCDKYIRTILVKDVPKVPVGNYAVYCKDEKGNPILYGRAKNEIDRDVLLIGVRLDPRFSEPRSFDIGKDSLPECFRGAKKLENKDMDILVPDISKMW